MLYRDVLSLLSILYKEPSNAVNNKWVNFLTQVTIPRQFLPSSHHTSVLWERLNAKLHILFSVFNKVSQSKYYMHFMSPHPSTCPVECNVNDVTRLHTSRTKTKVKTTSINAYWRWPWPLYGFCKDYSRRNTEVVTFLVFSSGKVAKMRPLPATLPPSFRLYFHLTTDELIFVTFCIRDFD
jgi:hypothetical protein